MPVMGLSTDSGIDIGHDLSRAAGVDVHPQLRRTTAKHDPPDPRSACQQDRRPGDQLSRGATPVLILHPRVQPDDLDLRIPEHQRGIIVEIHIVIALGAHREPCELRTGGDHETRNTQITSPTQRRGRRRTTNDDLPRPDPAKPHQVEVPVVACRHRYAMRTNPQRRPAITQRGGRHTVAGTARNRG